MSGEQNKIYKKIKISDSDYKAEDEGSASDNQSWRKTKKVPYNIKLTKKEIIQHSIKTLLPKGQSIKYENKLTNDQYAELLNTTEAEQINLNFKSFLGKVLEIIDGETYKIAVIFDGKIIKQGFRLNGVSTPDIKKSQSKDFANSIKKIMKEMIQGKIVRVETGEHDKSGRIFSRIYGYTASPINQFSILQSKNYPQFCINDYLIEHNMAKGTRSKSKNDFNKKDFQEFCQKYENKIWLTTQNYPLQAFGAMVHQEYEQKQQQDNE